MIGEMKSSLSCTIDSPEKGIDSDGAENYRRWYVGSGGKRGQPLIVELRPSRAI